MPTTPDKSNATKPKGCGAALLPFLRLLFLSPWFWLAVVLAAGSVVLLRQCRTHPSSVTLVRNTAIDVTPEEIRQIRAIREWEFLSIRTEELAEIQEAATFGDKQLVRIYPGTLRLGINMEQAREDWFTARGDTAFLRLPPVGLLDERFIDEARARSFYEKGTWSASARQQLYEQARRAMLRRCLTPENLNEARKSAVQQFQKIFEGFGFKVVMVSFDEGKKAR